MYQITSIINKCFREPHQKLNILTCPTHEAYETNLCKTGHNFYALRHPSVKDWNPKYRKLPPNYFLLNPNLGQEQIPPHIDFDLVLSQNKFGQFQMLAPLAMQMGTPLVSLEHTLPIPNWNQQQRQMLRQMAGKVNVFISEYSRGEWGFDESSAKVVHHGIDTSEFKPADGLKSGKVLSIVNDWINRDIFCGFRLWQEVIKGLPFEVLGETPGLSKAASSTEELIQKYQTANVFLNTSLISPVPSVVMEAMACGTPIVSTNNCMLPLVIEHGVNGFLSNDPKELNRYCQLLLKDTELATKMGQAARQTIINKFSLEQFIQNWNNTFESCLQ